MARYAVDIPYWDEWFFSPFLVRVAQGEATLGDWLAPHNEHIVVVPRLLLAALAFGVGWDPRYGMAASIAFAAVTFLALRRLGRPTGSEEVALGRSSDVALSLLLFSLVQWENWLWGMQSAWMLVNLCVAVALLATRPRPTPSLGSTVLAITACTLAALTTAQGLFGWFAVLPSLLLTRPPEDKGRRWILWLVPAAATGLLAAMGYTQAKAPAQAAQVFAEPAQAAGFFFVLLASPYAPEVGPAVVLGAVLFLAFAWSAFVALRDDARAEAGPWIGLGLFALMVAAATTWGRSGHGLGYAFASRYTTNAVLLSVAIWQLLRSMLGRSAPRTARAVTLVLLGVLVAALVQPTRGAVQAGEAEYERRSAGKACLELGPLLEPTRFNDDCFLYTFLRPRGLRGRWDSLVGIGVLEAPPPPRVDAATDATRGMVVDAAAVSGWAAVPDRRNPPLLLLSTNEGRSFLAARRLTPGESALGALVERQSGNRVSWSIPRGEDLGIPREGALSAWVLESGVIRRLGAAP